MQTACRLERGLRVAQAPGRAVTSDAGTRRSDSTAAPRPRPPRARPCHRRRTRTRCRSSAGHARGRSRAPRPRSCSPRDRRGSPQRAASPSEMAKPSASSSSCPGVRIVTATGSPPIRISSGSSTATTSPASPPGTRSSRRAPSTVAGAFTPQRIAQEIAALRHLRVCAMSETSPDFGTGLRAHLGLDAAQLELAAEPVRAAMAAGRRAGRGRGRGTRAEPANRLDALAALEAELLERERALVAARSDPASRRAACSRPRKRSTTRCSAARRRATTTSSAACGGGRAWPDGDERARPRGSPPPLERVRRRPVRLARARASSTRSCCSCRRCWHWRSGRRCTTASSSATTRAETTTRLPLSRYSTVTVFARLRGWSTLRPRRRAIR